MPSGWNILEFAQLVVAALIPLTVLGLGVLVARNTRAASTPSSMRTRRS